jgi:hypothetical protein
LLLLLSLLLLLPLTGLFPLPLFLVIEELLLGCGGFLLG